MAVFKQTKELQLPVLAKKVLEGWKRDKTFEKSVAQRQGASTFVFYEGPPSSNGLPGIHHVMARTIKDVFCQTLVLEATKQTLCICFRKLYKGLGCLPSNPFYE